MTPLFQPIHLRHKDMDAFPESYAVNIDEYGHIIELDQ
jgi:hypothetical protein